MKAKATIPTTLLPFEAVALGRLVTNTKSPAEEFYDSEILRNIITSHNVLVTPRNNFREVLRCTLGTSTYSTLTAIISSHFSVGTQDYVHLESLANKTYQLENSTHIFENICEDLNARRWLTRMIGRRRSIHMIVGFETIIDAGVSYKTVKAEEKGGEIVAPVSTILTAALAAPIPLTDTLDPSAGFSKTEGYEVQKSYFVPGEMVFAVQYRKLEFSWLSSRDIDKATLRKSRWMISFGVRRDTEKPEEKDVIDFHLVVESANAGGEELEGTPKVLDIEPLGIQLLS
ncbi:hypothetical protein TWF506_008793 [Arthrobotrys conoides]|uniref:Uncharacterized protein n=1 Tax=Arthrobotrys conoides TaxID=74498 RepID=A0AAN8RZ31_9PEZI